MTSEYVLARIQAIQQELEELRKFVACNVESSECKAKRVKLKGLWKGLDVADEDVEEAKRVVFKETTDKLYRGFCIGFLAGILGWLVMDLGTISFTSIRTMNSFMIVTAILVAYSK